VTCGAVWRFLEEPLEGLTYHAIFSGHEIFVYCPAVDLELENHIVYPRPGQLVYYFLPAGRYASIGVHKRNLAGHKQDAAEIAIWYGEGDLRRITESGGRGNLFATIQENLEGFAEAGHGILAEGRE